MFRFSFRRLTDWLTSPRVAVLVGALIFRRMGRRRGENPLGWSEVQRVLVVRLDEIGDVVLTTPFLRELRRNLPGAWITLVVKPAVYNLVENCPYVNEVLTFDWQIQEPHSRLKLHGRALKLAWKHLWRRSFDLAVIPRWGPDYYHAAFVSYFSGAPVRIGYSEHATQAKRSRNRGLDRLLTHPLSNRDLKHEVESNLEVIRSLGGTVQESSLELWLSQEDEAFAQSTLKSHGIAPDNLLVALSPGKLDPKRRWSLANFIQVADWLTKECSARVLVVGGQYEEPLGRKLQKYLGERVINLAGRTSLRETAAMLKYSQLYVGNDTGPKHLAAAVGVPVVEINAHPLDASPHHIDSPQRFRPWGVPHLVLQPQTARSPCQGACTAREAHCIMEVSVDQVKEAILKLWSEPTRKE